MIFGPDQNLYVVGRFNHRVVRYHGATGALLGVFATNNLSQPFGLRFGPEGNLYVVSGNNNSVQRFNGTTGAWIDTFVTNGSGGLGFPIGIELGPQASIYVASFGNNKVPRYQANTGAYLGDFVAIASGGLSGPNFMTFRPAASSLQITAAGAQMELSWRIKGPLYQLETATGLTGAVWTSVTNPVLASNDLRQVTLSGLGANRFFRLTRP
jgi:hypothetical protein